MQRSNAGTSFVYAVLKKYGEDNGGYHAALLSYYGFLALFPLLMVGTSIVELVLRSHPDLRNEVISRATQYFPILGDQLSTNIRGVSGAGLALIFGIILSVWGARGVADVFRHCLDSTWHIQRVKRAGFPQAALRSLGIIILGGIGFISASSLSSFAAGLGTQLPFRFNRPFTFGVATISSFIGRSQTILIQTTGP